jgi:hypothetical protein
MIKLKHQLVAALLFVLPMSGGAFAQQAPTTDDSGPVTCPPSSPDESSEACPKTDQAAPPAPAPAPAPAAEYTPPPPPREVAYVPWLALSVGGGVSGFAGDTLRNNSDVGGSWNVRLTMGNHSRVAGEVSYIGSAQSINGLGTSSNSTIVGNGAQADIRLNATLHTMFQPFLYGGVAWRHYSTTTTATTFADLETSDNVFEVPVGAGIAGYFGDFMLDVRGEFRFAWGGGNSDLNGDSLDRWGATGNFGFEF